jgi:lipopolysaccharide/colanic/teichoic acid biosynthesis glycosyltransferase
MERTKWGETPPRPEVLASETSSAIPARKRIFDLAVCVLASPVLLLAFVLGSLGVLLLDGPPVLYVSTRRVYRNQSARVAKFRAMIRHADTVYNRESVPVSNQRFLNTPFDSPLYTPVGRLYEQMCLTELPQVGLVLAGKMSLVGNRPLPENVIEALREHFPEVERRFEIPAGLTGPVQLVGRLEIPDEERLRLEITYCRICAERYRMRLDFNILLYTLLIALHVLPQMKADDVLAAMHRWAAGRAAGTAS